MNRKVTQALLAFAIIAETALAATAQTHYPTPPNPYCDAEKPPPPTVDCPDDGWNYVVLANCWELCMAQWQDAVDAAYADACVAYSQLQDQYDVDRGIDARQWNRCLGEATTEAERDACTQTYGDAVADLNLWFEWEAADLRNIVQAAVDQANADFVLCAHDCCERVPW